MPSAPPRNQPEMPRLFFLSRSYPPIRGGLELHNQRLLQCLRHRFDTYAVVNPRGKLALPYFLVHALVILGKHGQPGDYVLFGDLLTAAISPFLRHVAPGVQLFGCAHGTDVVWSPRPYQFWITRLVLPNLTGVVAVSKATRDALLARDMPEERVCVVPNGTDPVPMQDRDAARRVLELRHDLELEGRRIVLSLGRLVPRKSIAWFVERVVPALPAEFMLLIAGDGPERSRIGGIVREQQLEDRVRLLGPVQDEDRSALYNAADVFVMPNRRVPGDMEGFGITRLEAASVGLPVLASDLEGLREEANPGSPTRLVTAGDANSFVTALRDLPLWGRAAGDRETARAHVTDHYSWEAVAERYARMIRRAALPPRHPSPPASADADSD